MIDNKGIIKKHTCITSIIIVIITFVFFYALNGFRIVYESYDDYPMTVFLNNADDTFLYIGIFLSKPLFWIQNIFPMISIYPLSLVIGGIVSFSALNYVLIKKSQKIGLLFSLLFDFLFTNITIINLQYTEVAGVLCLASSALAIFAVCFETRKAYRLTQLLISIILGLWGSQLRFESAIGCFAFVGIFCVCVFTRKLFDNSEKAFYQRLFFSDKRVFVLFLTVLVLFACCFSLNTFSNIIKESTGFNKHIEYNIARTKVQDYPVALYEGNEKFYNEVDVASNDDLTLLTCFKSNKNLYPTEKMNKIAEYALNHDSGKVNIYELYFNSIRNKVGQLFGNDFLVYPVIGIALAVLVAICLFVFKIRNRIKNLFIAAYGFMWLAFGFYLRNKYPIYLDIFVVLIIAISIVILLIGNRYQYINVFIFNFCIIIVLNYMIFSRIAFRAEYTFMVPAIYFLLFLFDSSDIRVNNRKLFQKTPKPIWKVVLSVLTVLVVCYIQLKTGVFFFNAKESKYDSNLVNYINQHSDSVFFYDYYGCELLDHAYVEPFAIPDFPRNSIQYGGWPAASFFYDRQLKEYNVSELYKEMINNPKRFYVISKEDKEYAEMLENHFNAHYACDSYISLKEVFQTDRAWVYQVKECN